MKLRTICSPLAPARSRLAVHVRANIEDAGVVAEGVAEPPVYGPAWGNASITGVDYGSGRMTVSMPTAEPTAKGGRVARRFRRQAK